MTMEYDPTIISFIASKAWLAIIGVAVWVLKKAADKHIDSLEKLTEQITLLRADVAALNTEVQVSKSRLDHLETDCRS